MSAVAGALSRLRSREVVFGLAAVTIWLAGRALLARLPAGADPATLELAVTIDFTVTLSGLWYLLVVRSRGWPALTTAPVFLLSIGMAGLVLPEGRRGALEAIEWLALPVEALLLGVVALRARRASRAFLGAVAPDPLERIRVAARTVAPGRAADAIAYEVALLWHAFARRVPPLEAGPGETALTAHRRAGYGAVVAALTIAIVVETAAVHFLLRTWSPVAAWVLTGLSVYSAIWLLGDWRAIRARPGVVGPERLRLRLGLRWEVDVPRTAIESVEPGLADDAELKMTLPAGKGATLRLSEPVEAIGPYGIRRRAETIAVTVDDPAAVLALDPRARG